jgi:hypothetical protein
MTTRGVVVVAVFVGLSLAAPASAVTVTTQNVRRGLPLAEARHDIRQAAEFSSVVFTQEMHNRRASRFAPARWGASHYGPGSRGDCATFWDRDVWRLVSSWPVRISHEPFRAGTRWALVTVLRRVGRPDIRLAAVNVHLFTHTVFRPRAWRRAMARIRDVGERLVARYPAVVMGGDWNRTWGRRATFPGFVSAEPPRRTGPKGGRVDYVFWHGLRFRGIRVIGGTFSDHEGTRVRLVRP